MGQTYSYHITKAFGEGADESSYLFWWPISGFGQYCTNEAVGLREFDKCVQEDPEGKYKLVRYLAVKSWNRISVVGITGEPITIKAN